MVAPVTHPNRSLLLKGGEEGYQAYEEEGHKGGVEKEKEEERDSNLP